MPSNAVPLGSRSGNGPVPHATNVLRVYHRSGCSACNRILALGGLRHAINSILSHSARSKSGGIILVNNGKFVHSFRVTVEASTGRGKFVAPLNRGVVRSGNSNLSCKHCFGGCGAPSKCVVAIVRGTCFSGNASTRTTGRGNVVRPAANLPVASRRTTLISVDGCGNGRGIHVMHRGKRTCGTGIVRNVASVPTY